MAFPPEFIDELNRVTSISRILGKFVTWDSKKTKAAKGDYWACCPFHAEKTPSFHATESRGTYYCFSCHEKGNVFTFLQKSRGMSFTDAVRFLAAEANLPLPELTGKEKEQAEKVNHLIKIHEIAANHYQEQLHLKSGKPALDYLDSRGLKSSIIEEFGIGYAPNNLEIIKILNLAGFSQDQIIEAGLAKPRDNGNGIYTTFRDRIMFPIQDSRARIIAFGGRAMDPDTPAKYLNSPNTSIFNKGVVLYNLHNASSSVNNDNPLVVVEGYMDVIALHQAGFVASVAPLGTAVTPEHLAQLLRMSQQPILAMDGDEAGIRAAKRIVDLVLPLLEPGKTVRFCTLPDGLDPDDLIRKRGISGMKECLNKSMELNDFIWTSETVGKRFDTLNSKTVLREILNGKISQIKHFVVRNIYKEDFNNRYWKNFVQTVPKGKRKKLFEASEQSKQIKESLNKTGKLNKGSELFLLEATLISLCLHHPDIIESEIGNLESYDFETEELNGIRSELLRETESKATSSGSFLDILREGEYSQEIQELLDICEINILPEIADQYSLTEARVLFQEILYWLQILQEEKNLKQELTRTPESKDKVKSLSEQLKDTTLKRESIESNILDQDTATSQNGTSEQMDDTVHLEGIIASVLTPDNSTFQDGSTSKPSEKAPPPDDNVIVMDNSHRVPKEDFNELMNLVNK
ncbi:MAG: DNA primase [Rhodobacteraceae bacterium]|nr:DNA primase [Paracoccaceae bacterium]MYF45084.1 DNA primase [Paracoccaceae bacterium]MYI92083.1 DNA primase [Paracoccaceae bacterium]